MSSFKDTEGRIWNLRITVSAIRRIKDMAGIDLSASKIFTEESPLANLSQDYLQLGKAVFAAVFPEAEKRNLTEDAFLDALSGDCLEQMGTAFMESLADFFPGLQGKVLRQVLKAAEEQKERLFQQAEKAVQEQIGTFLNAATNSQG